MRIDKNHPLVASPIAHRGLHDSEKWLPENSYAAFSLAIAKGYPIETDIQLTKDGLLVIFHDDNLKRMTGVDSLIWDKTYAELSQLRLNGTDERIPLFSEFLKFVGGAVALLIEIKPQRDKGIEAKAVELLKQYKGVFAVQSFDPFVMLRIKKLAPGFIRGQLSTGFEHKHLSKFKNRLLRRMTLNHITKPDFINYDLNYFPLDKALVKNKFVFCWTVRSEEDRTKAEKYCDSYVFENIRP